MQEQPTATWRIFFKNDRAELSSVVPDDILRGSGHDVQLEEARSHHSAAQRDGRKCLLESF